MKTYDQFNKTLGLPWWLGGDEPPASVRDRVRSSIWEDPKCNGYDKPMHKTVSLYSRALESQHTGTRATTTEACTQVPVQLDSSPYSSATKGKTTQQRGPNTAENK